MNKKLSCLIFGLLLIAPCIFTAPASSSSSEESSEILTKRVMERFKLLALTLEEFGKMFTELLQKGPVVFKAVLNDPKVVEVKSEEMEKYLKDLRDYVERSDKIKQDSTRHETFDMFDDYTDIMKKFDSEKHRDLSPNALLIEKSLIENGIKEIKATILEHFSEYVKKFNAEVDQYYAQLNEKEKESEKEFIEWVNKLKAEKDIEKQIELFDNLVDDESSSKEKD